MSNDKPEFVNDEPIATGPVRVQYHGDESLARSHLRDGRALLGRMKTNYGVNDRVARGEPGGHYRAAKILGDGTRLEAFTNDGLDSIRITAPVQDQASVEPTDTSGESTSYTPTPVDFEYEPDWPNKKDEEEAVRVTKFTPYLWIGVRIVNGDDPPKPEARVPPRKWAQQLHVCVWEPTAPGEEPVILSNRNQFESLVPPVLQYREPKEVYPLQHWDQHIPTDFVDPREDVSDTSVYEKPIPTAIAYTDKKLCMILPHNVYDIPMRVPNYDPAKDEDVTWDVMFVSDPDNDLKLVDTVDPRLRMEGGYEGGDYMVKVMSVGGDCLQLGPVEVEIKIHIGKDDEEHVAKHRFTIKEHTTYRMGIMPMGWYKEFEPWPDHPCDACRYRAADHGPNPHGNHWWQGMAIAGVPHMQTDTPEPDWLPPTIHFSKEGVVELPETGFEPAAFYSRPDLCPGCHITSTRYHSYSILSSEPWTIFERNAACDGNTHVLGPPIDSPHYATTYKAMPGTSTFGEGHDLLRLGATALTFESDTGETYTSPIAAGDPLLDGPIVSQRWLTHTGIGGFCVGLDHNTGDTPTPVMQMLINGDILGYHAYWDNILGGPSSRTTFHTSWCITTTNDWNTGQFTENLSMVSLNAFIAAPFKVHNNPDAKGEDICARLELWHWDDSEWANLPPNHQR